MRSTLTDVESKLAPEQFRRVHRSAIINLAVVREITPLPKGEALVRLTGDAKVKVSRSYKHVIKELTSS